MFEYKSEAMIVTCFTLLSIFMRNITQNQSLDFLGVVSCWVHCLAFQYSVLASNNITKRNNQILRTRQQHVREKECACVFVGLWGLIRVKNSIK